MRTKPNLIAFIGRLVNVTPEGKKVPKFQLSYKECTYSPFEKIKGRNGKISFDYIEERGTVRLQAKNSLNFTTLYSIDKHNRYFYGFPYKMPIYSSQNRANPFYHNKNDLFLFVVHQGSCGKVPPIIDLIIIENGFPQRQSLFRKLAKGGFNRFLNALDDLPDIREDRKISVCLSFSFEPYV